jgi:DNA-binding transcriptional regulator YiaG
MEIPFFQIGDVDGSFAVVTRWWGPGGSIRELLHDHVDVKQSLEDLENWLTDASGVAAPNYAECFEYLSNASSADIHRFVRLARSSVNFTPAEFAELVGVSRQTLTVWEREGRRLRPGSRAALAMQFGWLLPDVHRPVSRVDAERADLPADDDPVLAQHALAELEPLMGEILMRLHSMPADGTTHDSETLRLAVEDVLIEIGTAHPDKRKLVTLVKVIVALLGLLGSIDTLWVNHRDAVQRWLDSIGN